MKKTKAEEDLEAIWDYSFRQFGVVQADAYIGRIAAAFDVLDMHDIGTYRAELGEDIWSLPMEQHMIFLCHHIWWLRSFVFSVSPRILRGMNIGNDRSVIN